VRNLKRGHAGLPIAATHVIRFAILASLGVGCQMPGGSRAGTGFGPAAPTLPPDLPRLVFGFDSVPVNSPPIGLITAQTGPGRPARWVIRSHPTAPTASQILAQEDDDRTGDRFSLVVSPSPVARDVSVAVRCLTVGGKVDQACGIVFRYTDANNYYVVRGNSLEDNIRFYFVKDGSRHQLASWNGPVAPNEWHELRADAVGDSVSIYWDGRRVIAASDSTFPNPGLAGLWTKADSHTLFDDLRIVDLTRRPGTP
jgi:hypothetical protein